MLQRLSYSLFAVLVASLTLLSPPAAQRAMAAPRYSNGDICVLQTLLVMERLDRYKPGKNAGFSGFYRDVMKHLLNSDLLAGQSNQRKIFLLNSLHYSSDVAYRQRKRLGNKENRLRLQKELAGTCSRQIGSH
ncbi:hypothetical protein [Carnimonas bestiolae]|uniref:hypothetical protein n=1 Tax=Carnimonas bestiolae TaxID=3402172 RepID=UPI003EDB7DF7